MEDHNEFSMDISNVKSWRTLISKGVNRDE